MNRSALALLAALALPACTTSQNAPIVDGPIHAEGSTVALRQAVAVGEIVLTPMAVLEDSRCPINARCVHAGRIVVQTRIDGAGWRETLPLELGEPEAVRDYRVALVSAEPGQMAGQQTDPAAYRFAFEGGPIGFSGN